MTRRGALLLVVAVFLAGTVVGVLATHVYYMQRFARPGAIADAAVDFRERHVSRRLDLRPDQQEELARILADVRLELADVRRDTAQRLREVRDEAATRLLPVLDDEQRARLEEIQQEQGRLFDEYLQ